MRKYIFLFLYIATSSCIHRNDATGPVTHFEHKTPDRVQDLYVSWQNDSVIDVQVSLLDHRQQASFRWMATHHKSDHTLYEVLPHDPDHPVYTKNFTADPDDPAKVYTIVIANDTSFAVITGERAGAQLELDSLMLRQK